MSATVDGPDPTAFNDPNRLEIKRLDDQIKRYTEAREKADGQQKKHLIDRHIEQLGEQKRILFEQIGKDARTGHGEAGSNMATASGGAVPTEADPEESGAHVHPAALGPSGGDSGQIKAHS